MERTQRNHFAEVSKGRKKQRLGGASKSLRNLYFFVFFSSSAEKTKKTIFQESGGLGGASRSLRFFVFIISHVGFECARYGEILRNVKNTHVIDSKDSVWWSERRSQSWCTTERWRVSQQHCYPNIMNCLRNLKQPKLCGGTGNVEVVTLNCRYVQVISLHINCGIALFVGQPAMLTRLPPTVICCWMLRSLQCLLETKVDTHTRTEKCSEIQSSQYFPYISLHLFLYFSILVLFFLPFLTW